MPAKIEQVVKVGVVGCGEVAQAVHLPTLSLLHEQFKAVALCDVSPTLLDHCGRKFGIEQQYSDFRQLCADDNVDLVLVLAADEYHAEIAITAADAGKHVLLEKPMCLTKKDAHDIAQAAKRNNVAIIVGYMRRYATAFEQMKEEIRKLKSIEHATVRDIIGMNSFFSSQSGTFPIYPNDFPADASADRLARGRAIAEAALSPEQAANPRDVGTYRLLGGLGSHDLSAMRELLGMPKRCLAASRSRAGGLPYVSAMFEFDGFTTMYETGIDHVADFDAHIEVFGDGKRLKLKYDTPYVKGLPITLEIKERDENGHYSERVVRPTYEDAYTLEWLSIYSSIIDGKAIKTTPEDAAQDLETFDMIMKALVN
ncbi:hypothetical protein JCM10908_000562 [Rhodotorula pacifica]|uniref:Gfo/Idh/MocA family oxidoreductase n=1 Tax=Rhodotorula pacifica TaxID=1495444 RepID=UPI003175622A